MVARNLNFSKVKKRDGYVCQKCGKDSSLEVHHIKPLFCGGDNSMENLITLCHGCHKKAPNDSSEFYSFLSLPLTPNFSLVMEVLTMYHLYLNGDKNPKASRKSVVEFFDKKLIPILNFNLNKCKSKKLWEEQYGKC